MIWLGMIGAIISVGVMVFFAWLDNDSVEYLMWGGICLMGLFASLYVIVESIAPSPTALDVYRGKTTLEITYRDSIAIDTTVVYKVK